MSKLRIVEASLCLRFYAEDGWTREKVSSLGPEKIAVTPRAWHRWLDKQLELAAKGDEDFDPVALVAYYAVYDESEQEKLPSKEELRQLGYIVKDFPLGAIGP